MAYWYKPGTSEKRVWGSNPTGGVPGERGKLTLLSANSVTEHSATELDLGLGFAKGQSVSQVCSCRFKLTTKKKRRKETRSDDESTCDSTL